ncbi:NAD(P)-binding protein [Staphylococcus sp. KG4-3]|uniref:precorrin-2 dehydrogenase n=1 Tax=Staphylococcus xylosus TaxID=1288 RepID=A0A418IP58_STAXY|nr:MULTISPECIES: NAD(P)-binding protein [Staphylococcus]MBF0813675.1 NAD(P)-binding protein [Staphylococcus saprophyticus]MDW8543576.1 NAD(P)-binding protein [Staphylococcus sp. KG4-1]MRF36793.1 NAD(P)-binding protein [Staphylococcus sp. KY49P]MDW8563007.1 NAD(P)-binding protein [Staphylococcus sp. KG4-3]PTI10491.1 precorrin-2 dehydrogenase [Staphylococcus xylosus]
MPFLPLMIDISQKQIVVVGGGKVAERRVSTLVHYATDIHIISPTISEHLRHMVKQDGVQWHAKSFEAKDIKQASLIIAATNNSEVNQQILASKPPHAFINMTSIAKEGDIVFPSILRRGKLTLSISTNGASPKLTAQILSEFKERFDDSYGDYVDFLYECRQKIKQTQLSMSQKEDFLKMVLTQPYREKNKQLEMMKRLESMK